MALSLGVRKGSTIKVGGDVVTVTDVVKADEVHVRVRETNFTVTDKERTQILPDVFVFCGSKDAFQKGNSRLAFEAPRRIRIERLANVA